MQPRSEEEILAKAPLKVTFGDKPYEIKPLTILKAKEWRSKVAPLIAGLIGGSDKPADDPEALRAAIMNSPEQMAEIVLSYSGFPREEILENATEEQMMHAFNLVMGVAFSPFLTQQAIVKAVLRPESLLASLQSTKVH